MRVKFIPLDFDYLDRDGKSWIRIWGKTEEGKRICVIDTTPPYFWIIPYEDVNLDRYIKKIKAISLEHGKRTARVVDVKKTKKKYLEKEVTALQVFINNPKDAQTISNAVKEISGTQFRREIDINFITRYIIDKNVKPLIWQEVVGKEVLDTKHGDPDVDIILEADSIKESPKQIEFKPKILAFDIETDEFEIGKGKIIMLSLADGHVRKVFTWKHFKSPPKEVEFVKDEEELIEKFLEFVKNYKPDIITGYFSDAFDFPYLRARADLHKIRLDLGLDGSSVTFRKGALTTSEIKGLVHVDLYKFVHNILAPTLQSETVSLNDVAKELIGEEKVKIDLTKITNDLKGDKGKIQDVELKKFALYNLQDSVLTAKLFEKLWPNIAELTRTVSEPLFNVSRTTYSHLVEHNIIHKLKRFNEIAQARPIYDEIGRRRMRPKYIGAFVKEPIPNLYDNVVVFDFRSFYPNVIVSFNISQPTLLEKKKKGAHETPEFEYEGKKSKFYFEKQQGFLPQILKELLEKRKEVKQELKRNRSPILEARDYALKTLLNATYGYYGFFGARYYSPESAASITAISRYYIHKTIQDIEKGGYKTIYADTDSVMFSLGKKTQKDALDLLKKINKTLPGTMELELEDFYKRGIFVTTRSGTKGAKKKYALMTKKGSMKVRGFESVRRDRCMLAKKTQDYVLRKVLEDGTPDSASKQVHKVLKEVREGKAKIDSLIIRTQLTKDIDSYKSIGPHVVIAKKMHALGLPVNIGTLIPYVISKTSGKLIREKARLPEEVKAGEYDANYYMDNQIIPPIEGILGVFGITPEQLKGLKKQRKLNF
ncbi:DNA-directed DNA polymerase [Nanoarchaeota archaeon]